MENRKPKISIITVVYNGEKELERTILSVIHQNYENLEYIIIDGGSTDKSVEIINKYAERISYWKSEPDKGIYDAMNKGADIATGEWILFRNCGDYFSSLSDISNIFMNANYDEYDILYGDAILWDKYGYRIEKPEIENKKRSGVMPMWHPSTFVRASVQKKMKFDLKYKLAADHHFVVKCQNCGMKFKYIPVVLSIFNIGEGASVVGQCKSKREHFFIYGGKKNNKLKLLILNFQILKTYIVMFMKKLCPTPLMLIRRKLQHRESWKENYTIDDMINNALSYKK